MWERDPLRCDRKAMKELVLKKDESVFHFHSLSVVPMQIQCFICRF